MTGGFFQTSFIDWLVSSPAVRTLLQLRENPLRGTPARAARRPLIIVMLEPAQLHAADFSGDRLRQFRHQFERRMRLNGAKPRVQMPEDRQRRFGRTLDARNQQHIGLGDRQPDRIGARHHGGFRHRFMLQQHAFQLERADAVVGGFEHVVGAADKGEIAFLVGEHDVAAAIEIAVGAATACRRRPDSPASGRPADRRRAPASPRPLSSRGHHCR